MSPEPGSSLGSLRIAAYAVFLCAWGIVAIAAVLGSLPRRGTKVSVDRIPGRVVAGTLLQWASVLVITLSLPDGPLRPGAAEMLGALALAPLGAGVYVWAVRTQPNGTETLVTRGAYGVVRHPIYFAFFALLIATGLLASSGFKLAIAAALYLAGSEIRIAQEEAELAARFPDSYSQYIKCTRWRYFPGIR